MKLFKFLFLVLVFFAVSCEREASISQYKEFSLTSDKYQYNIFEKVNLVLKIENEGIQDYDSIKWEVPDKQVPVRESHGIIQSFVFVSQGKYSITVNGYKDGKIVKSISKEIEVVANKDFLNINWDQNESVYNVISKNNTKHYDLRFNFVPMRDKKTAYARVYLNPFKRYGINYYNMFEREELSKYMTELYGESKLKFEDRDPKNTNLTYIYNSTFKYSEADKFPVEIWETKKSKIVLYAEKVSLKGDDQPFYFYYLLAEPLI